MSLTADIASDIFASASGSPFGRRQRRARGARIPTILVTGFLGAGKTTLIRELLATPEGANSALVINEFGEVGIDQALLASSSDTVTLLGNGCVCCAVRSDLEAAMSGLASQRARGEVPSFERVVIETSGLADPAPILQTFMNERALGRTFHLDLVVTVVDATNGLLSLREAPEARSQAVIADRIVLTKTDLASPDEVHALTAKLRELNGRAEIHHAIAGRIAPGVLLDEADVSGVARGMMAGDAAEHAADVDSFVLVMDAPLPWPVFARALETLLALRGPDLLRIKGLVAVEGRPGPVVIQAVRHVAHPPVELEAWPDGDRRSRLVFITRGVRRDAVASLFDAVRGLVA
jgi:G3E family GTPase